jgi:hypothetical protein
MGEGLDKMALVMQWLEVLGTVAIVGLIFTYENKNNGVSRFISSIGAANAAVTKGIGPG